MNTREEQIKITELRLDLLSREQFLEVILNDMQEDINNSNPVAIENYDIELFTNRDKETGKYSVNIYTIEKETVKK